MSKDYPEDFFSPPLWRQRRNFILEHLLRFKVSSVLDYGCGEASVLSFLIPPSDPPILRMSGVDLDREILEEAIERCVPWKSDYEVRRTHPLTIDIYHGSIKNIDSRFEGYEAIVCSEVIEHVYDDVLDHFFPVTLGHYQPNVLIVTTPNGEYNINFPDLKYGTKEATFRHDDHKFEWTRQQFEEWCNKGAKKYGYSAEFHGIGLLNNKQSDLTHGHCTQACIFTRNKDTADILKPAQISQPHTLLKHIEFPFYDDLPLTQDELLAEVESYIEKLCIAEDYYVQQSNYNCVKPLTPPSTDEEEEEEEKESLHWCLDWSIDTNTKINALPCPPQHCTIAPIQLPIKCLWDVLRLRQICRTKEQLLKTLQLLDLKHYEVTGDDLVVKKVFYIANDTQNDVQYSSEDDM